MEGNMRTIYVSVDDSNAIIAWGSTRGNETDIEVSIEEDDPFFKSPHWFYSYDNGVIVLSNELKLNHQRAFKLASLRKDCSEAIYGYFNSTVDGIEYRFSCDAEAQSNFEKVDRAFEKDRITTINWTAYDANNNIVRLSLDYVKFEGIYMSHLQHIQGNISRLRDTLQPEVESATLEDLPNITY